MSKFFILFLLLSSTAWAQNNDGAYLDPAYENLIRPVVDDLVPQKNDVPQSDTLSLIQVQSPVRSQGSRGTCSIFSATALVESLLVMRGHADALSVDLSEQYLQYMVNAGSTSEGSNAPRNFSAILGSSGFGKRDSGMAREETLPYNSSALTPLSSLGSKRCSHLDGRDLESCLIIQRDPHNIRRSDDELLDPTKPFYDPDLVEARQEGREFKRDYLTRARYQRVYSTSEAKKYLEQGVPVILELDFYYGAWNHSRASSLGLKRNMEHWHQGIVGHAAYGSLDRSESMKERAGHSVLLVGYDNEKTVTTKVLMQDGSEKTFTYEGVYYFKNSWGTSSFGKDFEYDGQNFPGYGMITQEYAHSEGSFYRFSL